ncbi:MAG: hypothetical protein M0Q92_02735 [Methanoregula sp.]|jgi:hypothetical protein|nr:hypothetical protein [Methanoregula sp.]
MKPNVDALVKQVQNLTEAVQISERNQEYLQENLTVLEQQLTEQGWERIGSGYSRDFTERARVNLYDSARIYWLKNPLIRRAELVQALYVFAQGMTVKGDHETVDAVVQKFIADRQNYNAFTGHQAWMTNEAVLTLSGNLFFILFTNESTGRVIVRQIPLYEISDIITDPEDSTMPWFYKRTYTINEFNALTGIVTPKSAIAYYPDWRHNPKDRPDTIGGNPVHWDAPVYHVKVNCLPDMKFGVSEVYSCLDWAKAYKTHLENGNKIWQALASFAFRMTTKGGSNAITAAASKIRGLIGKPDGTTTTPDKRPVASTFTSGESVKLEPFKTSGMTISMEDARAHRLMICSGSGIPDHIESGDPSTGNLATSTTMERPLELQFLNRQQLWIDIWQDILEYVIDQAIRAPKGPLEGEEEIDEYTDEVRWVLNGEENPENPEDGTEPIPRTITIAFPPLLEHDQLQTVQAIIAGATADGKPLAGTMDLKTLTQLIFKALKVPNADEKIDELFPEGSGLVMQTAFTTQQQANAAAQALALAQQPRAPPYPPSDEEEWGSVKGRNVDVPAGGVQEAFGGVRGIPFDIENSQAYRESSAALIAARRKFTDAIMKGIEEHYPVEEGS